MARLHCFNLISFVCPILSGLNIVLEGYATGNFSEVAAKHGVHMTQMTNWKKQLLAHGSDIFKRKNDLKSDSERRIDQLEKTCGRLAIENDILKKTAQYLG